MGNCGGILGALMGFDALPERVKTGLAPYMDRDYNFTSLSNTSASELCYQIAQDFGHAQIVWYALNGKRVVEGEYTDKD